MLPGTDGVELMKRVPDIVCEACRRNHSVIHGVAEGPGGYTRRLSAHLMERLNYQTLTLHQRSQSRMVGIVLKRRSD